MELQHEGFPLKETFQKGKFRGRVLKKGAHAEKTHSRHLLYLSTADHSLFTAENRAK